MTEPRKFWKPIPFDQLKSTGEGHDWLWEGVLARKRITLLSAQAKAGKTTLLAMLLREMANGGSLLGCNVSRGRVVVVSEETEGDWTIRRDNLGIGSHAAAVCLPFMVKPGVDDWLELLREAYTDAKERPIDLVAFDTLSHLWPVREENSNSQMQEALMPLRYISEQGSAVLLIHHAGASGLRSRGATELEAFADQLAHLELTTPTDPSCRNRRFTTRGRLSSPERLEISLNEAGDDYQVLTGGLRPIRSALWATLAGILPREAPGLTIRELRGAWPEGRPIPGDDLVHNTLTRCGHKAGIRRSETKPVTWWLPK